MHKIPTGIFAINKPVGMTSHDVVARIRRVSQEKRIGHAGTLDPLASGVLVMAVGREATKQLTSIVLAEKEYIATVHFGITSTTDDGEGELTTHPVNKKPSRQDITKVLRQFTGTVLQVPPIYSAIHVQGQKAYKAARRGKVITMPPRTVELKEAEILSYRFPILKLRLLTGSGFYVRSLARDLGEALNVGGYLIGLERTRVGQFSKQDAISLEQFK